MDDGYESSIIASHKEIVSISGNTNTMYPHLSATKQTVELVVTGTIKI